MIEPICPYCGDDMEYYFDDIPYTRTALIIVKLAERKHRQRKHSRLLVMPRWCASRKASGYGLISTGYGCVRSAAKRLPTLVCINRGQSSARGAVRI